MTSLVFSTQSKNTSNANSSRVWEEIEEKYKNLNEFELVKKWLSLMQEHRSKNLVFLVAGLDKISYFGKEKTSEV